MNKFNEWVRLGVVYPLAEKVKHTNSMDWYRRILEMNTWSPEQIRAWQEKQLQRVVDQACNHTVYWKRIFDERGLKPSDIRTMEDLKKLPILTKNDIRAHYEEIVPDNVKQFRYRKDQTGGTTGEPMRYLVSEDVWGYVAANKIVAWRTTDYRFGDAFMALGSASIFQKKAPLARRVLDWIRNEKAVNSMNMDDALCQQYIDMLNKKQIHYIYGYASAIYLLAKCALDNKINMSHMRGAFTTSENLTDVYREMIEKAFGCRVMDCYGSRDAAVTAYEICPKEYHLGYGAYVELVDEIEPGVGTLLATNLLNMAFPMLRYEFGDVAELDNSCPNYNGQVLHRIYGRTSDVLRLDNGHVLTSPGFTILMRNFNVKAYDIQKLSGSHVRMQMVVADGWNKEQEKKLVAEMLRFVGKGCEFTLEYVKKFETHKNGKRRYFMNDLSLTSNRALVVRNDLSK